MTDHLDKEKRSANMAAVRSTDTAPELRIRSFVHSLGFRFRLHSKLLPGTPDLVFPRLQKVIFVHGCFWHRHAQCKRASTPSTRIDFWQRKFRSNVERDRKVDRELKQLGWKVMVIWECELRDFFALEKRLEKFLHSPLDAIVRKGGSRK
jgi:DNA mismatch endonuclease, patch repair protein